MSVMTTLLLQAVTIVCGFIVPRYILTAFGSDVNGLISSATQFLGYIVLLEAGVGGVVRAALYKPLSINDVEKISGIVRATERFFRVIAFVFLGYMIVLAALFPFLVNKTFDFMFTAAMVLIIGASTFMQYYFGMTYQILLQADQRRYVTANIQVITVVLNTITAVILIRSGCSALVVKAGSSIIFMLRPLLLRLYVKKKYTLIKNAPPDNEAISQRWDGLGHHVAYFLHTNTDVTVLTVFSKLSNTATIAEVSVYAVYYSIVAGVEKIISSFSSGLEAAFGDMLAKDEKENLNRNFTVYEFFSFTFTTICFTSAALLIVPFIAVYTKGVNDADYIRPMFAYVLAAAEAVYCIRIPYNSVTLAAGKYKETRNGAFVEAGINVALSVVLVAFFGMIGVAVGTLAAMTFRTVQYAYFLSKNILNRKMSVFIKRAVVSAFASALTVIVVRLFMKNELPVSYLSWFLQAIPVFAVSAAITSAINIIVYRDDFLGMIGLMRSFLKKTDTE